MVHSQKSCGYVCLWVCVSGNMSAYNHVCVGNKIEKENGNSFEKVCVCVHANPQNQKRQCVYCASMHSHNPQYTHIYVIRNPCINTLHSSVTTFSEDQQYILSFFFILHIIFTSAPREKNNTNKRSEH